MMKLSKLLGFLAHPLVKPCMVTGGKTQGVKLRPGNNVTWQGREAERLKLLMLMYEGKDISGSLIPKEIELSFSPEDAKLVGQLLGDMELKKWGWGEGSLAKLISSLGIVGQRLNQIQFEDRKVKITLLREAGHEDQPMFDVAQNKFSVSLYQPPDRLLEIHKQIAYSMVKMAMAEATAGREPADLSVVLLGTALSVKGQMAEIGINAVSESLLKKMAIALQDYIFPMLVYSITNKILERGKYPLSDARQQAEELFAEMKTVFSKFEISQGDGDRLVGFVAKLAYYMTLEEKFGDAEKALAYFNRFIDGSAGDIGEEQALGLMLSAFPDRPFLLKPYAETCKRCFLMMLNDFRRILAEIYDS